MSLDKATARREGSTSKAMALSLSLLLRPSFSEPLSMDLDSKGLHGVYEVARLPPEFTFEEIGRIKVQLISNEPLGLRLVVDSSTILM